MMNCRRASKLLSNYLDENLKPNLQKELESHLEGCTTCSSELVSLQKVEKLLRLKVKEHPSAQYWESFWPRISKRLEGTKMPVVKKVRFGELWEKLTYPFLVEPRVALNVAIVILLTFSLILLHQRGKEINLLQARIDQAQKVQAETLELLAAYTSRGFPVPVASALIKERPIGELFQQLEASYSKEEFDGFMACFSREHFPDYNGFQEKIRSSFDDSNNLNLSLTITSINISGDSAIAKAVWTRRWDSISLQKGADNTIQMRKIGTWKITDIDDESAFVIGRGTFKTYIQ